ncbi:hypothetical protein MX850_04870 [Erysipelothrix sp. Poltava]|nr:hypothetical protein MX850_04870 [Erysipelothrix sp. Poltava]
MSVVLVSIRGKGFIKVVPFLVAIFVGYFSSVVLGLVDLGTVFQGYSFIQIPKFQFIGTYKLDFTAVADFRTISARNNCGTYWRPRSIR